ncbi:hypothetical protein [Sphingomonas sp. TREG-RG-20F-R18-01]|uniref:hypothetical protein n=1 Tax=Sphingomonas sp. TREG-RG-20F-R18-01 TaxID=2914982 RepID=UPI001F59A320|nr:hypothetical protein [Sphingomonas sp. TREG-RG-20F-R18-01]
MTTERTNRVRGIASAVLLAGAGLWVAGLCLRTAAVRILPPETPVVRQLAPHNPDLVLQRATLALVKQRGILDAKTLAAVRRAALAAPLDARPYLILGHQQLLDGQPQRAVATLEAGQRLDPRQRVIHLLLLDRYLRTGQFDKAATQFAVSARLVGSAGEQIAAAMAQMSLAPATHDAVRQTLRTDPGLERGVLVAMARSKTDPSTIFGLASPAALRDAGTSDSWGPALIARLAQQDRYADARAVWQRVYRLSPAQAATPVFDPAFQKLPGSAPFNWTLASGTLGAADVQNRALNIDYYGRDSGELASQLLVLRPGSYQFGVTLEGSKTAAGSSLAWTLQCATGGKAQLLKLVLAGTGTPHRAAARFTVPANCPAQRLALIGEAGEFPVPINATLRDLDLHATSESTS